MKAEFNQNGQEPEKKESKIAKVIKTLERLEDNPLEEEKTVISARQEAQREAEAAAQINLAKAELIDVPKKKGAAD